MADAPKKVYWDSCCWIAFIGAEVGRWERCNSLVTQAKKGDLEIWTSSLTLAEVYKFKCGPDQKELAAENDGLFEEYLKQAFVFQVHLDDAVGTAARRLLRAHSPPLKKPNDAVHLATAALNNVEVLYTFDSMNLIPLSGVILRADGQPLVIAEPPAPITSGEQSDMFNAGH